MWNESSTIKERKNIQMWCVVGDFNSVRWTTERVSQNGGNYGVRDTKEFKEFITRMELEDIPLVGRGFTWYKPNGTTRSRIDRIMVTRDWFIQWPSCSQSLDHWFEDKDFIGFVDETWKGLNVQGWGAYVLKEKLKLLKSILRGWNSTKFSN
uniref:Uncharacterized protein n=1 Tax=Cajanus cajan TaxID=3821 RepID=A0A151TZN8_CAJCA|nr:hypothetical protein KK1_005097 [Cajanus cajan]